VELSPEHGGLEICTSCCCGKHDSVEALRYHATEHLAVGRDLSLHLPPGVVNVLTGDRTTGAALIDHKIPQMVSITGSVRAGMEVAKAASQDLKRVHLELGGKAPVIVFSDADIALAVEGIGIAGYFNAGQDCTAATRVLVHKDIHDEFVSAPDGVDFWQRCHRNASRPQ